MTRRLIIEHDEPFLFPAYGFREFEKHKDEIRRKSKLSKRDFEALLAIIVDQLVVVPERVLDKHRSEARGIVEGIDLNDAPYIACALAYPDSIVWSDDVALKRQDRIRIFTTAQIRALVDARTSS